MYINLFAVHDETFWLLGIRGLDFASIQYLARVTNQRAVSYLFVVCSNCWERHAANAASSIERQCLSCGLAG